MWLLLFFSKSKRELISLIISHAVNILISILFIIFGIKGLLKGQITSSCIFLAVGLFVSGITIYLIQKSIRSIFAEKMSKDK